MFVEGAFSWVSMKMTKSEGLKEGVFDNQMLHPGHRRGRA